MSNSTIQHYKILFCILIINVLSYMIGVLPPAGRVYYLPDIICGITQVLLLYFMFAVPLICLGGILFVGFWTVKEHLAHKGYLILGVMLIAELLCWYRILERLMSI